MKINNRTASCRPWIGSIYGTNLFCVVIWRTRGHTHCVRDDFVSKHAATFIRLRNRPPHSPSPWESARCFACRLEVRNADRQPNCTRVHTVRVTGGTVSQLAVHQPIPVGLSLSASQSQGRNRGLNRSPAIIADNGECIKAVIEKKRSYSPSNANDGWTFYRRRRFHGTWLVYSWLLRD